MTVLHMPFEVIDFWFNELHPHDWFAKSPSVDERIRQRFKDLHDEAVRGELAFWRKSTLGRLAEIIVLDQFSRSLYRGSPRAYENDAMALVLAEDMVQLGLDRELSSDKRIFAYLPFMHSESRVIHEMALKLFGSLGVCESSQAEIDHKKVIDQFGRYPHRNGILGRESTEEEKEYLKEHDGF